MQEFVKNLAELWVQSTKPAIRFPRNASLEDEDNDASPAPWLNSRLDSFISASSASRTNDSGLPTPRLLKSWNPLIYDPTSEESTALIERL